MDSSLSHTSDVFQLCSSLGGACWAEEAKFPLHSHRGAHLPHHRTTVTPKNKYNQPCVGYRT